MLNNILVLGGGLQGLSVSRSLKEVGYGVICAASRGDDVSVSRFVDFFEAVDFSILEKDILEPVISIVRKFDCSVIIPMSDRIAKYLSRNKNTIEDSTGTKCAVPNNDKLSQAGDKWNLMNFCQKNGFPHPRTMLLNENNFSDAADYVGFPALIKPNHSVGARGIRYVSSFEELKTVYKDVIHKFGESTLQEFLEQGGRPYYNVMLYRNRSSIISAHSILKIIRYYPLNGGSSCYGETIEDFLLLNICSEVLDKLDWWGFADFDVLTDSNGNYKIIEINPRVPASLRAAAVSGVNFPEIIVRDVLGLEEKHFIYEPGKGLRYLGLDCLWFMESGSRFKAVPPWFIFFRTNLYYQDGGYKDFRAMFRAFSNGFSKIISSSFRKSKSGMN